jgi:hypothetical protein
MRLVFAAMAAIHQQILGLLDHFLLLRRSRRVRRLASEIQLARLEQLPGRLNQLLGLRRPGQG